MWSAVQRVQCFFSSFLFLLHPLYLEVRQKICRRWGLDTQQHTYAQTSLPLCIIKTLLKQRRTQAVNHTRVLICWALSPWWWLCSWLEASWWSLAVMMWREWHVCELEWETEQRVKTSHSSTENEPTHKTAWKHLKHKAQLTYAVYWFLYWLLVPMSIYFAIHFSILKVVGVALTLQTGWHLFLPVSYRL